MLDRPRSSRIYYNGKFFAYPLRAFEALIKLGVFRSALCLLSYVQGENVSGPGPEELRGLGEQSVRQAPLQHFLQDYTEKVWGMSCREISADWAAQRIKGLSLGSAIKNALFPSASQRTAAKSSRR